MSRIGSWSLEVPPNHRFELLDCAGLDIEQPLEIGAYLVLHPVDLPKSERALADDAPGLVGVGVIADDLGSNHECGDEQTVAGGTACGDKPGLQSLQKVECSKGRRGRKPCAMEGIGDEVGEGWRRVGSGRG